MAFWKKQPKDPWDMKPGEVYSSGRVYEAPPNAPEEESSAPPEPSPKPMTESDRIIAHLMNPDGTAEEEKHEDGAEKNPLEVCPWCGKDMVRHYLYARQGGHIVYDTEYPAPVFWGMTSANDLPTDNDSIFAGPRPTVCWYCEDCEKMTLSVPKPKPVNDFSQYVREWNENEKKEET